LCPDPFASSFSSTSVVRPTPISIQSALVREPGAQATIFLRPTGTPLISNVPSGLTFAYYLFGTTSTLAAICG
jgi:hypothetical protein